MTHANDSSKTAGSTIAERSHDTAATELES